MGGDVKISGPTNQVSIDINGTTESGTNIIICLLYTSDAADE